MFFIRCIDRVMDALLAKFQPSSPPPHFFVVSTLTSLTHNGAASMAPYLKGLLATMTSNMKSVKKDNLKYAYALAFSSSAEAIMELGANDEVSAAAKKETYYAEVDFAHDVMFTQWISSR